MDFSDILAEIIKKEGLAIEGDLEQKTTEVINLFIEEEKKQGTFC